MKLKELLEADSAIDELEISVYTNYRLITQYWIGRHRNEPRRPPKYRKYLHTTKAGDIYVTRNKVEGADQEKIVLIDKNIQYGHELPYNGVGVILKAIPAELLNLEVDHIMPYGCGGNDYHGYYVHLVSGLWTGVTGEDEVVEDEHE